MFDKHVSCDKVVLNFLILWSMKFDPSLVLEQNDAQCFLGNKSFIPGGIRKRFVSRSLVSTHCSPAYVIPVVQ